VSTLAGAPHSRGYSDGVGPAAQFGALGQLAYDPAGFLYVADLDNRSIRKIDVATAVVTTLVGSATQMTVMLGALPGVIPQPWGVALLPSGGIVLGVPNAVLQVH